jgi:hypothetical protein
LFAIAIVGDQTESQSSTQVASAEKPLMAEQAFKDVQLLRGISVKELLFGRHQRQLHLLSWRGKRQ